MGIEKEYAEKVNEKLNLLLSNVQISYMNVRGLHWNITGKHFFKLHEKFEEIYDDLNEKADEIAERILMLEGIPVHAFSEYLKLSGIKEITNVRADQTAVKEVLEMLRILLSSEREILKMASDHGDDGTVDLLTGYISGQEKTIWMLNAFLK